MLRQAKTKLDGILKILRKNPPTPRFQEYRAKDNQIALVLVHGFSSSIQKVWTQFAKLTMDDDRMRIWDVLGAGYSTSLRIDIPNVWAADPNIKGLADGLRTTLSLPPFNRYRSLAIVSHSMGGLVCQRAILDDEELRKRISHLFLLGTPSGGLKKGRIFAALKRQIKDIDKDGLFIKTLRRDWDKSFSNNTPFYFRAIGGDRDEFVPPTSSLEPFNDTVRVLVSGNHSDIARPLDARHEGFAFVIGALAGNPKPRASVDSAKLATELGEFQSAVDILLPQVDKIDESALISLALALDGLERGREALNVLENQKTRLSTTDALGTLAGRVKRRWLLERNATDLSRAQTLYREAYGRSTEEGNHSQAFYHMINLAFLELMSAPTASGIPQSAAEMARAALQHCGQAEEDAWSLATEGEANLILGKLDRAVMFYERAIKKTASPRDLYSMYNQAVRVATRVFGAEGARKIEVTFGAS